MVYIIIIVAIGSDIMDLCFDKIRSMDLTTYGWVVLKNAEATKLTIYLLSLAFQ